MSNERLDHHQSIPVRYPLPNIPSGPSNLQRLPKSFYSPRPMVEDCATYNGSRSYDGLPTIPEDDIDFVRYYNDILPSVDRRRYYKRSNPFPSSSNHGTNSTQHQYFEDELVTYHRSPVSLQSGYTPHINDNILPTFVCDSSSNRTFNCSFQLLLVLSEILAAFLYCFGSISTAFGCILLTFCIVLLVWAVV